MSSERDRSKIKHFKCMMGISRYDNGHYRDTVKFSRKDQDKFYREYMKWLKNNSDNCDPETVQEYMEILDSHISIDS